MNDYPLSFNARIGPGQIYGLRFLTPFRPQLIRTQLGQTKLYLSSVMIKGVTENPISFIYLTMEQLTLLIENGLDAAAPLDKLWYLTWEGEEMRISSVVVSGVEPNNVEIAASNELYPCLRRVPPDITIRQAIKPPRLQPQMIKEGSTGRQSLWSRFFARFRSALATIIGISQPPKVTEQIAVRDVAGASLEASGINMYKREYRERLGRLTRAWTTPTQRKKVILQPDQEDTSSSLEFEGEFDGFDLLGLPSKPSSKSPPNPEPPTIPEPRLGERKLLL